MRKVVETIFLSLLLSGCSDFLEEDDKAGITNFDFYSTEVGYETLMTASYSSLRNVFEDIPFVLIAGTDMYQRPKISEGVFIHDYAQLYPTDQDVLVYYRDCYNAIQTINMALYYNDLPVMDNVKRETYKAELKFLRAFYHFLLLEQFGGIIINDEATFSPRLDLPRSTLNDSYDFIINEMEEALPNLPVDEVGRVNRDVCNHYLSKVYLTRGWDLNQSSDFEKARQYALSAIDGREITIPFKELWSPINENNEEFIFSIQYDINSIQTISSGNRQQSIYGPSIGGATFPVIVKNMLNDLLPSWNLHNFYGENDTRYDATFMLVLYIPYFDYYDESVDKSTLPIQSIYPRVWGREYTPLDYAKWLQEHPGQVPEKIFPFKYDEEAYRAGIAIDSYTPVIKKFDSPLTSEVWDKNCSVRDIVLARLAETYFLYAEACIGLNDFAQAAEYIQHVLNRPGNAKDGIKLYPNASITDAASQSEALDAYLMESAKEFAGELLRWPELRRTGKLKEFCGRYNYDIKLIGLDNAFRGIDGEDKIYRPIPQEAIDLNRAPVEQNPGYVTN